MRDILNSKNIQYTALLQLLIAISLSGLLLLAGCSGQMPTGASSDSTEWDGDGAPPLNEINVVLPDSLVNPMDSLFSQTCFMAGFDTAFYQSDQGYYKSSKIQLGEGSSFAVEKAALTAPEGWPLGENVIITMEANLDTCQNEIIFKFGPSGCHFDPPAELWLSWKALNTANATLYYLNDKGERIEHLPDNVDYVNKRMCIFIDHFSRYSVAYSD